MSAPEAPAPTRPSRRFRRTKPLAVGAVAIVTLLAGTVAVSARSNDTAGYRTATAATHTVDQVLDTVGTIEPVSQASVAFPVDGTVSSVAVEVGDTVAVGQELASLDVDDLTTTLHEKQATLDQAELTLTLALAGEDVTSASGGGTPSGTGLGRSTGTAASSALSAAQQDVLDAQKAVDAALVDAQAALNAATAVCTPAETATASDAAATDAASTDDAATADEDLTACETALSASLAAQQIVTTAQKAVSEASDALTSLLSALAEDSSTTTTTTPTETTAPTGSGTSSTDSSTPSGAGSDTGSSAASSSGSTSGSGATGSTESSSPSAEDLIAYQKQVDASALAVSVAEQAIAQATIVSPIAGTVTSVGLAEGDDATAASATQAIVVVGDGGVEVTTSVSVTDLPDLEVGQAATVSPDGGAADIEGEIVRIGAAADTTSGTASYTVTISLTGDTEDLGNGSTASVEITTDAAGKALAVPTSAITVNGDKATVQVVEDGTATTKSVETGAVGQTYTEVTDGLTAGDEVVLADLAAALPSSATSSSSSSSSAGGTFPGGGTGGPPTGAMPGN